MVEKVVQILEDRKIAQATLERQAGLSQNRISKWKDGVGEPTARQAVEIANVLGVPVLYLICDQFDSPEQTIQLTPDEIAVLDEAKNLGFIEAMARLKSDRKPNLVEGETEAGYRRRMAREAEAAVKRRKA